MATLILNLPDAHIEEIVDTFAAYHDWQPEDGDKGVFCAQVIAEGIMQTLRAARGDQAAAAARQAAVDEVNQHVQITIG